METELENAHRGGYKSNAEATIAGILTDHGIHFIYECYHADLKLDGNSIPDFYLPTVGAYIDYDGAQHFRAIERFGGEQRFKRQQELDRKRDEWALSTGIKILYLHSSCWSREEMEPMIVEFIRQVRNGCTPGIYSTYGYDDKYAIVQCTDTIIEPDTGKLPFVEYRVCIRFRDCDGKEPNFGQDIIKVYSNPYLNPAAQTYCINAARKSAELWKSDMGQEFDTVIGANICVNRHIITDNYNGHCHPTYGGVNLTFDEDDVVRLLTYKETNREWLEPLFQGYYDNVPCIGEPGYSPKDADMLVEVPFTMENTNEYYAEAKEFIVKHKLTYRDNSFVDENGHVRCPIECPLGHQCDSRFRRIITRGRRGGPICDVCRLFDGTIYSNVQMMTLDNFIVSQFLEHFDCVLDSEYQGPLKKMNVVCEHCGNTKKDSIYTLADLARKGQKICCAEKFGI